VRQVQLQPVQNPGEQLEPRFEQIAAQLASSIAARTYRAGDRMPSVRELARTFGASPGTVFEAYGELERQGLVHARPQSGFFVSAPATPALPLPGATRPPLGAQDITTATLMRTIISVDTRDDVVRLDTAAPHPDLVPLGPLRRSLARAGRRHGAQMAEYIFPPGHGPLRQGIARLSVGAGLRGVADDFVVTTGAAEAVALALRAVTRPGDIVVTEAPTYYGSLLAMQALGLRVLGIPTRASSGIDRGKLESVLKRHAVRCCYLMPNFSNPLGSLMSDEDKQAVVNILARRAIPLVEDDVAGDLFFGDRRPSAAKRFDKKGLVLYCCSLSKTLAAGYRIGWIAPGQFHERVVELQWATTVSPSSPAQLAAATYLGSEAHHRHLRALRSVLRANAARMSDEVSRNFPDGTRSSRPRGGLALWIELPEGSKGLSVYQAALHQGVAVMPGVLFSPGQRFQSCIRLCFGLPWTHEIATAVGRVGEIARRRGRVRKQR
jgi:DNA-binding transcriptional MocR family regulator